MALDPYVKHHPAYSPGTRSPSLQATPATGLTDLPDYLLLLIYRFAESADGICFCLSSRRVWMLFHDRVCPMLPRILDPHVELSVATRLERDIPECFACNICNSLHTWTGDLPDSCHTPWFEVPHIMRTHAKLQQTFRLSFIEAKLAMKRFNHGPEYGITTESLSRTQICHYSLQWAKYLGIIHLFSRDVQTSPVNRCLYVRMQDIVIVRKWSDLIYGHHTETSELCAFETCIHTSLIHLITPRVKSLPAGKSISFEISCQECYTDSHIELGEFEHTPTVIMTRWVNLGPCLTPEHPMWKAHVFIPGNPNERPRQDELKQTRKIRPRMIFEKRFPFSFEELRQRNLLFLRNQQYKRSQFFVQMSPTSWTIPFWEESSTEEILRSPYHQLKEK